MLPIVEQWNELLSKSVRTFGHYHIRETWRITTNSDMLQYGRAPQGEEKTVVNNASAWTACEESNVSDGSDSKDTTSEKLEELPLTQTCCNMGELAKVKRRQ